MCIRDRSRGFEIETEMTIHAVYNNMQVDNVVITYRDLSLIHIFSSGSCTND